MNIKHVFSNEEGLKFKEQHMQVRALRNHGIAHAGLTETEGCRIFAVLPNDNSGTYVLAHSYFSLPKQDFLMKSLGLINYVYQHTQKNKKKD